MAETPALAFESVTKSYSRSHLGRTTITRGIEAVDLSVARGEAFGLLGLNGSGKTTTFKLALGLLTPGAGTIRVLGLPPSDSRVHARIGFLPELPYFYPFLTPEESLSFYGRLSGLSGAALKKRVKATLETVGLLAHAGKKIGELSKGLVQRVGLAQALLHEPGLIVLDEPVSGLDPLAIKDIRDLLARMNKSGVTLVLSSHSISELEKLCDRVGILKEGRLVRTIDQKEWRRAAGGLEEVFVEAVR